MNKKKKQRQIILLISLIIILFIINYQFIDGILEDFLSDYDFVIVERIIDGDTLVVNKTSVRLLGINCPERGEIYYSEAKDFLEESVLNESVRLEFGKEKYDRYKRILAYVFVGKNNINLKLVEEGFANFYFPSGKDIYYQDFKKAWEKCVKENKNLCEKSKNRCADCIILKEFNYKNQEIIFYNKCDFNCELTGWKIKDEGRKNFVFEEFVLGKNKNVKVIVGEGVDSNEKLFWKNEKYVWTSSGDTLFLRDNKGGLVLWDEY